MTKPAVFYPEDKLYIKKRCEQATAITTIAKELENRFSAFQIRSLIIREGYPHNTRGVDKAGPAVRVQKTKFREGEKEALTALRLQGVTFPYIPAKLAEQGFEGRSEGWAIAACKREKIKFKGEDWPLAKEWTPAETERLRDLIEVQALSYDEVTNQLRRPKWGVIFKVSKLGLVYKFKKIKKVKIKEPRPPKLPKPPKPPKPVKPKKVVVPPQLVIQPPKLAELLGSVVEEPAGDLPLPTPLELLPRPAIRPTTGCQWPHGDPKQEDFHFCGSKVKEPGKPYCSEHYEVAYMKKGSGYGWW